VGASRLRFMDTKRPKARRIIRKNSKMKRKRSTSPNPDMLNVNDLDGGAPEIVNILVVPALDLR
jgi:hypothetical protein